MTPDRLPAWKSLARHANELVTQPLDRLLAEPDRFNRFSCRGAGITLDLSRQRLTDAVLAELTRLADEQNLAEQRHAMFSGAAINATEQRAVLHTALRAPVAKRPKLADSLVPIEARLSRLVDSVRSGTWRGYSDAAITDVIHIGIGGSHLGPQLAVEALNRSPERPPRIHFVANIDGVDLQRALRRCDPARTLVVVASKSFTTLETRINANSARQWFLERVNDESAIEHHFIAISNNVSAAVEFGVSAANVFELADWVGGRYSLWSGVGIPVALAIGNAGFAELLAGAHAMDEHFCSAPWRTNVPALLALTGIWNSNFLGIGNHAILPYTERLRLLPDYLQQLEMESNGKSVHTDGTPVSIHTTPILWGGRGSNGQHAFHQLLHQGTRSFSADFILAAKEPQSDVDHQSWLLANALAQGQAMLKGHKDPDPHKGVPGGHPTTTLLLPEITPHSLGALLALYEHKVFCQGVIWDINSFDQWGVELGKRLALPIHEQLGGSATLGQDASTRGLIQLLRREARDGSNTPAGDHSQKEG